ncbi:pre-mRNA-processing protein 40C isoform X2 [Abrus precatorius]|uniref:Pre-mRNA-processing protein 40C isoform X2 n=1 Tax=Abrus precatorius TaxID=3816 RepID=A0A8B8LHR5_ABRPR|nr:pre-mRNA-processing protein 40C isoform X2 [Abrus precatorius]XP_027354874.1 pre-mRNA-processing protein 40C isoform X2 [Abrus precatorius]
MASPAWLPQETQPSVSGETPLPLASSTPSAPAAAAPFSYAVHQNVNTSGNSQQSSTHPQVMKSNSAANPMVVQHSVPGLSSHVAPPSFSYNINQSGASFPGNQQHAQSSTNISDSVAQDVSKLSSASSIPHSTPAHTSSSIMPRPSDSNYRPATSWMPTAPSFPVHPVVPTPGNPGPPGLASTVTISSNSAALPTGTDSSSAAVLRPSMPSAAIAPDPSAPQKGLPYPSMPAMAASPQGLWLQPPQMSGVLRPPFLQYPAPFPGPFPFPARGVTLPAVPIPDSQPPGVTPVGAGGGMSVPSAAAGHQLRGTTALPTEVISGPTDDRNKLNAVVTHNENVANNDHLDAWTAHKTDAGIVYYYNAVTGESTYDKPVGFKGEPHQVSVQPTPVSMVDLPGTDWLLVSTSDGKKYYYNNRTKTSCWQIPNEVVELKKKQDGDVIKDHLMSVPNTNVLSDRGSGMVTLNAPAINTGGRDAAALKPSNLQSSSSALDLIKKKLQDSGTPVASSSIPVPSVQTGSESNGSKAAESTAKGLQVDNNKDKLKDANGDANVSDTSSDSEDEDSGPSKEERIIQFKDMLKERGVAPFSKWEKELPKIVFDPRFKAIPSYSARRSLFEHYVKTRAEEERKEKRAAQKAAVEGFKQLLDEASEDIGHNTDYQTLRKKWGNDPRFEALDRKEREHLLNERVLPLKKAAEEKAQAMRAVAAASFKSMLKDRGDISFNSRWSRVKENLRDDPRYKSVRHEDRETLFNEYISELKAAEHAAERETKAKREEQEKLRERERELRKRKEREEQEMERVRIKIRRKEAVTSFQALLVETIKDSLASWTESKPRLEKDPQGRATNPDLDPSDTEKLFREHVKMLQERCAHEFRTLLAEVFTSDAASQETDDGKTVLNSWSTAKRLLKSDPRYNKVPRKEREGLWRRYAEDMLRRQKASHDSREEKHTDAKGRSLESSKLPMESGRSHERR